MADDGRWGTMDPPSLKATEGHGGGQGSVVAETAAPAVISDSESADRVTEGVTVPEEPNLLTQHLVGESGSSVVPEASAVVIPGTALESGVAADDSGVALLPRMTDGGEAMAPEADLQPVVTAESSTSRGEVAQLPEQLHTEPQAQAEIDAAPPQAPKVVLDGNAVTSAAAGELNVPVRITPKTVMDTSATLQIHHLTEVVHPFSELLRSLSGGALAEGAMRIDAMMQEGRGGE